MKTRPGCFCAMVSEKKYQWWYTFTCTDVGALYYAVLGCIGLYWAVMGSTWLCSAALDCTRLYVAVLDCTGRSQQLLFCVFSHFRQGDT